jgi:hypothetical protein
MALSDDTLYLGTASGAVHAIALPEPAMIPVILACGVSAAALRRRRRHPRA